MNLLEHYILEIHSEKLWCQIANIIEKQQAEIEKLKATVERLEVFAKIATQRSNDYRAMRNKAKTARAEAIKEFAEKLKEKMELSENFKKYGYHEIFAADDVEREIDELIIEMVGVE